MPSLFIIGNGFDLAHGLKTRYKDFYDYLSNIYPDANGEELFIPAAHMQPDGGDSFSDSDVVNLIKCLISIAEEWTEWNNVESSVGKLDYQLCLDEVEHVFDRDGELDDWKTMYAYEDFSDRLAEPLMRITDLFKDWIQTLDIRDSVIRIPRFDELIDANNDYFLTFNYTETLESIYNAVNVCHIHGSMGEQIYFGHGVDIDFFEETNIPFGAETSIQGIHNHLRKDTFNALLSHQLFFKKLSEVDKIYSFGFSFSDVDLIYIEEICKNINLQNVVWYLHDFDEDKKRISFEEKIKSCGFKGEILVFNT